MKAFVRYDKEGSIVLGGPIFSPTKPKHGKWVEIPLNICCITTTSTTTTVYVCTPTITGLTDFCVSFDPYSFYTEEEMTNYYWEVIKEGQVIFSYTENPLYFNFTEGGVYTISVTYSSQDNCFVETSYIEVVANPSPTLIGEIGPIYVNDDNEYTYYTDAGQTVYYWSIPNGATIISGGGVTNDYVTVKWVAEGEHHIMINYYDTNGCLALLPTTLNILVIPTPTTTTTTTCMPPPILEMTGGSLQVGLTAMFNTDPDMLNYFWEVGSGGNIVDGGGSDDDYAEVEWYAAGIVTISITYTNGEGCSRTTTIQVEITE